MAVASVAVAVSVVASACGNSEEDRFSAAAEKARTSTTGVAPETTVPAGVGEPSDGPGATAFPGATTTTTIAAVPADQALIQATDAMRAGLGAPKVLQVMVQFPQDGRPYGSISYQVPEAPANVDERDWRNGEVQAAEPVRLTPLDDLATDLWDLDSVNWPAIAAALPAAQGLVEQKIGAPIEGSAGVTHLIAANGAPFYEGVVVRVYVDGGPRRSGGYVAFRPDGSVADVVV